MLKQFSDLGLSERVLRAVAKEGYSNPTPIQADAIPTLLSGQDIVGIAQTGTGKTAAFVLPLLHTIAHLKGRPTPKSCRALILAPTRELAAQIADSIKTYGHFVQYSVAVIVGGAKQGPQIKAMARGVDIIVATPGRLEDHMARGNLRLSDTTHVVLDEADQMMDMGFIPAIRRIMKALPRARQTILFSATMPKQIRALANDFLKNPAEISVAPQSRPIERIEQKVFLIDKPGKRRLLAEILDGKNVEQTIVFTRTKHSADKIKQHLEKSEINVAAIHGNKSQQQRERTLKAFRAGRVNVLVATDIAARGIDVDNVSHVINFDLPTVPEAYVHRIGRTARAGKSGIAISLCDHTERRLLREIEKTIGAPLSKENRVEGGKPVEEVLERKPKRPQRKRPTAKKGAARLKNKIRSNKKSGDKDTSQEKKKNNNKYNPLESERTSNQEKLAKRKKPHHRGKPKTAKAGQRNAEQSTESFHSKPSGKPTRKFSGKPSGKPSGKSTLKPGQKRRRKPIQKPGQKQGQKQGQKRTQKPGQKPVQRRRGARAA